MLDTRQEKLLNLVIENHIDTALPVGSKFLVAKAGLDWSEATVRNDLRYLEEQGFLTHPHTSAGRVPTAKGYRYYLKGLDLAKLELCKKESVEMEKSFNATNDFETACKHLAKTLMGLSEEMVLIAFSPQKVYYTGLSNLFQKPDFAEQSLVVDVSAMFDNCEEALADFFVEVDDTPRYFLGDEHPFGSVLSVLSTRFGKAEESLIALVGPLRMDYKHNWELIKKVQEII